MLPWCYPQSLIRFVPPVTREWKAKTVFLGGWDCVAVHQVSLCPKYLGHLHMLRQLSLSLSLWRKLRYVLLSLVWLTGYQGLFPSTWLILWLAMVCVSSYLCCWWYDRSSTWSPYCWQVWQVITYLVVLLKLDKMSQIGKRNILFQPGQVPYTFFGMVNIMHYGLAWDLTSSVHHILYSVVCIQARPECLLFIIIGQFKTKSPDHNWPNLDDSLLL